MAQKMICDYCLREITANYTRMSVQTLNADGTTAEGESSGFEFHPRCYNALQGLIRQMQQHQEPPPLDPSSPPPVEQPVNDDDPEVVIPVDVTPAPEPGPPPDVGPPEPGPPPDVGPPTPGPGPAQN